MKNEADEKREPHALDSIEISEGVESWENMLKRWKRPMLYDDRLEWLHKSQKRDGNGPERFLFFLELADRHGEHRVFDGLPQNTGFRFTLESYASIVDLKSNLSANAFAILCNNFFAQTEEQKAQYPLMLPYEEPLFSKLLWFFRPFGGYGGYDNLRPYNPERLGKNKGRHYLDVARKFAERFTMNAWSMLNARWNCTGQTPDFKPAELYWREIIILMRHFDLLKHIEHGQHVPTSEVFKKMLDLVFEENNIVPEKAYNFSNCGPILEPLISAGNLLARALYTARLNIK